MALHAAFFTFVIGSGLVRSYQSSSASSQVRAQNSSSSARTRSTSTGLDIFRVYATDRLDLMDDLIRHPAPGLVT